MTDRHDQDVKILQNSLNLVLPQATNLVATFYARLFRDHPELRRMFPTIMTTQEDKLLRALIALVAQYHAPTVLTPALTAMGIAHAGKGVNIVHYGTVGVTLLATLEEFLGEAYTSEVRGAWLRAYTYAAGVMMSAGVLADNQG